MASPVTLTAVYESVENGWVQARLEELPAVITAAPTRAEAEELLDDALAEYLASLDAPPLAGPDQVPVEGEIHIYPRDEQFAKPRKRRASSSTRAPTKAQR